ncbi:hypothetical protein LCGC14_0858410 [marine sediment metagenome]|uniref:Exonuclease domain-containing protein n=1 Tax=marine sediment metagenome TaxID=412755 RepID=A0A0F9PCZ2_9ZZZZ
MSFSVSSSRVGVRFMGTLAKLAQEVARRCPGGKLPSSYLVVDLETSGLDWSRQVKPDVVVQIGFAAVRDRQLVRRDAVYLKRPLGTMSKGASDVTGITDEILIRDGIEPAEIYPKFVSLLQLYRKSGCMFMGHNIVSFDAPFLAADLKRQQISFKFKPGEYIDTGMIYKAVQLRTHPGPHESLHQFFLRVKNTRSRVKWRLALAIERLKLHIEHNIDLNKAHDAGFDCWMTHLLFEELRRLSEDSDVEV